MKIAKQQIKDKQIQLMSMNNNTNNTATNTNNTANNTNSNSNSSLYDLINEQQQGESTPGTEDGKLGFGATFDLGPTF